MTWKHFKELMEQNKVPDDAVLRVTEPEEGGVVDVTGILYGPNKDGRYEVEFCSDEP
jgi:hypothetical protein